MQTQTVGEILQQKRDRHRLSLGELSQKTKIKLLYLEALEANQFEKLPPASFVKGYIRTYGRVFGFDHKPVVALLRRDFKETSKGKLVPREYVLTAAKGKSFQPVTLAAAGLTTAFIGIAIYIGMQWYSLTRPPKLEIISPKEDEFVSAKIEVKGKTVPEAMVQVNSQPVSLEMDGSFSTEIHLPREGIATITVEATDRKDKTSLVQRTVYVRF